MKSSGNGGSPAARNVFSEWFMIDDGLIHTERRPPTEPFWQFCAALTHFDVDYG